MTQTADNETFVRAFQRAHGLKVDGWAGKDTYAAAGLSVADLTPDPELIAALKIDEGLRLKAYKDTVGVWTVGYGHAHVAPNTVWTQARAERSLLEDAAIHNHLLAKKIPWISSLDPVRRRVLQNMAYNLGVPGLLGFKNTLEYVRTGQYEKAADGMLASLWAKQVKGRAVRLAQEMRTGKA